MNGKAFFAGWDVLFADGNAAARTFGRAHRRRPYHFSCGFVSQGRRRGARRWTNMRNVCWRGARRRTKSKMIAGEVLADGQKQEETSAKVFLHPKVTIDNQ